MKRALDQYVMVEKKNWDDIHRLVDIDRVYEDWWKGYHAGEQTEGWKFVTTTFQVNISQMEHNLPGCCCSGPCTRSVSADASSC